MSNILAKVSFIPFICIALVACEFKANSSTYNSEANYKKITDAVHTVLKSDREVYTKYVISRLVDEEKAIKASEHWKQDSALPLPAQMFRLSADLSKDKSANLYYSLISQWPINKKNSAITVVEVEGLKSLEKSPGNVFYKFETLGGAKYFTAMYPDVAITDACISCHNKHEDSPRSDFRLGETMGAVVIRVKI